MPLNTRQRSPALIAKHLFVWDNNAEMSAATKKTEKKEKPRAYLLKGDDEYLKQKDLDKLLKALVSVDFIDFDLEQMDGASATSDRIMAGLNVPPFSSRQRVVLVKHANKMNEHEQQKLASKLEKTPSSGCMILVNSASEKADGRVKKGSEVIGEVSRAVRKIGEVREFGRMRADAATRLAQTAFSETGKKIDSRALSAFIQRVGTDSAVLLSEAQKLIDYVGGADIITLKEVNLVTSETAEEKVFKLVDAVAAKKQAPAIKLLHELFEIGSSPEADAPKTLATIARQFRLIWQMKMLSEMGVHTYKKDTVSEDIKSMLPSEGSILDLLSRQAWMSDRLSSQARSFSRKDLVKCFNSIAKADLMLKGIEGSIEDPTLVMELLVIELARGESKHHSR